MIEALQHTPGDWLLSPDNLTFPGAYRIDAHGMTIGFVLTDIPAGEANARLIAAAPDLLEALQGLLDGVDDADVAKTDEMTRRKFHDARAAITKATA